jgi:AcrR family transcriptional regulator
LAAISFRNEQLKRLRPAPDLLLRVERAFLDHGYAGLSMLVVAEACGFSARALYNYFSNKEDALRAVVSYRNEIALAAGFAAGRATRANGGSALDIIAEIMNVRFGETRRLANASRHVTEMSAEIFTRCNDIVTEVALYFEAELAKLIDDFQYDGLLQLRADLTSLQIAEALANGARGVNQRLPPIRPAELEARYREMCGLILYGSTRAPYE